MNYIVWGIAIELDFYKQETFIILYITWSFKSTILAVFSCD
jgi:hypothetical protein